MTSSIFSIKRLGAVLALVAMVYTIPALAQNTQTRKATTKNSKGKCRLTAKNQPVGKCDPMPALDMAMVKKQVTDKKSKNYYPKLVKRFLNDDTTMTVEDYRMLYYGQVYQPGYDPLSIVDADISKSIEEGNFGDAVIRCDSVLAKSPANLRVNYLKALSLFAMNQEDRISILYRKRFAEILSAVLSSGDGTGCGTSYKTLYIADEYSVMDYLDLDYNAQQLTNDKCDRFTVTPSQYYAQPQVYFDASESLKLPKKSASKR